MKALIKRIKENYIMLIIVLFSGIILGIVFSGSYGTGKSKTAYDDKHEEYEHGPEESQIWTCSMHPQIRQDSPGDCPICGMDLVPLTSVQAHDTGADEIVLSEAAAGLADIRTTAVVRSRPEKIIFLQGKVQADESNITELTARFGGRIEQLHVSFTGEDVRRGEKLATVYSPEMLSAQRELIEAAALKEERPAIYESARLKLRLWDISDEQIDKIEKRGEVQPYFDVLAPASGTVMRRHVAAGDYVTTGEPLFMIADLSELWIVFDAYEEDLQWISRGDKMEFSIQAVPGKKYVGRVSFVDPVINPVTRTAGVRLEINNTDRRLKPGMFAGGTLYSTASGGPGELLIPRSSVLWTGKRSVVYVKVPERETPVFSYREILLGPDAGEYYIVEEGLEEGEVIATNGVFKIDASAQLEGKVSMMNPGGAKITADHDHGGMDMKTATADDSHADQTEIREEDVPENFKKQLTGAYDAYIDMKDAFVATDAGQVRKEAGRVIEALEKVDMSLLKGDAHMRWMDQLGLLNKSLGSIANSSDIKSQRQAFLELNKAFYLAVKTFGLVTDTVYYQYCPMADDNRGGYWLSNEKEIRNPYFGDMMMTCGEVKETITMNNREEM